MEAPEKISPGDVIWDGRDGTLCAVIDEVDDQCRWVANAIPTRDLAFMTGMPVKFDWSYPDLWLSESGTHARPN